MARAALVPPPEGLVLRPDLLTPSEEEDLLGAVGALDFAEIVIRGRAARRTACHYGVGYDYESRAPLPAAEPIPGWLLPLRARSADLAGLAPDDLAEALVQRYPAGATIGWHRDAPAFEVVVGVSLASACRMRFRRGGRDARQTAEVALPPRSAYVLSGASRWSWEHSIPPTPDLRYSVTFRSMPSRS